MDLTGLAAELVGQRGGTPQRESSMGLTVLLAIYGVLTLCGLQGTVCAEAEFRLIRDLMSHYDSDVRPSENISQPVEVLMDLTLHQIVELDEQRQVISTSCWQRLFWRDDHLRWNRSQYEGIQKIRLSANRLWRPDITLVNDVSDDSRDAELTYPATVWHDGRVAWLSPRLLQSSCPLDMTYFPWDEQVCVLQFAAWTHDSSELRLRNKSHRADETDYLENGEWELMDLPIKTNLLEAPCCQYPFMNLNFYIHVRRRAMYYVGNLIFPAALITTSGVLVFALPPESGEKVSLAVTILLATSVYQLIVAEHVPAQSKVTPLIGRYIMATQILLAVSTALTVMILKAHHHGETGRRVPRWIRVVVLGWLSRLLCVHCANSPCRDDSPRPDDKYSQNGDAEPLGFNHTGSNESELKRSSRTRSLNQNHSKSAGLMSVGQDAYLNNQNEVAGILRENFRRLMQILHTFQEDLMGRQEEAVLKSDWAKVAMVLDRLFLIIFITCTVSFSLGILVGHQNYRIS